jgi:uncharacterized membrane protein YoaK (UPF0700 family)
VSKDWRSGARDMLVVVLTVTTGAVNAATFLYLGHVFSSVVTGTMVLLGVAAGTHNAVLAENCGVALASYVAGVAVGAPLAARRAGRWLEQSWLTVALALEFCVLTVFSVGWELSGGRPSGAGQLMLLANAGFAMGIQGATVRHLGEVSTTYLTGTLTGVIAGLVTGRKPDGLERSLGIFAALVVGACASAVVTTYRPALLPVVVLVPLALVVWFASARFGPRPGWRDPG